jgi:hypothetical protein
VNYRCVPRLVFLLCCSSAASFGGLAQTAAPTHQLTLIHPSDPGFDSLLTANFPGLENLDGYAVYRPFLVLLRNDTSHAVRAYLLQWEARSFNGEPFRLADLIERNDPGPASERVALAPGELRLISDHFDVGPKEYQSKHQHNWVATMMAQAGANPRYASADPASVVAAVDAAIFDDGFCVGADHRQIFVRYQRELDAEHDLSDALLRLLDQKASEADVVAFLRAESDAAAKANESLSGSPFIYAFYRGRQAQFLLTLYHRGGIASVMTRAWQVSQRPRMKLSSAPPQ